jgi:hypothetical protein
LIGFEEEGSSMGGGAQVRRCTMGERLAEDQRMRELYLVKEIRQYFRVIIS